MSNESIKTCAECGQHAICVNENDKYDAKNMWSKLLESSPKKSGAREVVIDEGGRHFQDRDVQRDAYGSIVLVPVGPDPKKEAEIEFEKMKAKYGIDELSPKSYKGLPASIGCRIKIEIIEKELVYTPMVFVEVFPSDYYTYKHAPIVSNDDGFCPICKSYTRFCDDSELKQYDNNKGDDYINELHTRETSYEIDPVSDRGVVDTKEYLKNLVQLSQGIYFLENRIRSLYQFSGQARRIIKSKLAKDIDSATVSKERQSCINEIEMKKGELLQSLNVEKERLKNLSIISSYDAFSLCEKSGLIKPSAPQRPVEPTQPSEPVCPGEFVDSPPEKPSIPMPEEPAYHEIDQSVLYNKPVEPEYAKPGFFNRRRVNAENNALKQDYEQRYKAWYEAQRKDEENRIKKSFYLDAVKEYEKSQEAYVRSWAEYEEKKKLHEKECDNYKKMKLKHIKDMDWYRKKKEEYDQAMVAYDEENNRYVELYKNYCDQRDELVKAEIERRKIDDAPEIEKKIDELNSQIAAFNAEMEDIKNSTNTDRFAERFLMKDNLYAEAKKSIIFLDDEVEETANVLLEQYNCLNQLLSHQIIFPKYNNVVAWSTMYEYFVTGRVSELSGPNGAYNLYENELRANIIISKLDVIIDQLEAIKESQYTLYTAIKDATNKLNEISGMMNGVVYAINSVKSSVDSFHSDTNQFLSSIHQTQQYIEYNTAKTAEYARISAKTTTAIAFMKAIWG